MPAGVGAQTMPARGGGGERLRILVVDEALPYPPDSGKRLRTWNLLRRLAARHDLVLLCYSGVGNSDGAAEAALTAAGIACHTLAPPAEACGWRLYVRLARNCFSRWPYSVAKHHTRRLRSAIQGLCDGGGGGRGFDLVQIEWTPYASHLGRVAPPHLIASHNIETQIWRRRAAVSQGRWARLFFGWQAAKMERFERRAFARARAVTTVSGDDRDAALRLGALQVGVVANGVDVESFRPVPGAGAVNRLLFVGSLDWFPNQDAVRFFVDAILPLIRARVPAATLQIVGRRPAEALRRHLAGRSGVELVGEVDDVRPFLAGAAVVVAPLRVGGGSRIKIIEALAMEKAVVATSIGAEGLDLLSGRQLLIADGPQQFARLSAQLLTSPVQAQRLGLSGGRWVREHHNWDDCALALEAAWRRAVGARPSPGGSR